MVSLNLIQTSNSNIKTTLPSGLVAIFAGGTNGVGETTVKQFAKYALQPRVYIIGRSRESGDRIVAACRAINPDGTFVFLQNDDMSLMRNVDAVCEEISRREKRINILCLTIGTLQSGIETKEELHYLAALTIHARSRFISNLLPLIRQARDLRRVLTVYCAGFEGTVHMDDFQSWKLNRIAEQAHIASITTLDLLAHQKTSPDVSFIHNFPGSVESGISRGDIGPLMRTLKTIWGILGSLVHIPLEEAGDRHVFLCTSSRFPAREDEATAAASGVPLCEGLEVARGIDSSSGSGVYSIDDKGESSGAKIERVVAGLVREGMIETVRGRICSDIEGALDDTRRRSLEA